MLCSNCSGIFDGTRKLTGFVSEDNEESHDEEPNLVYYSHYPTLRDLLQSAENGCHICFIICNMFSHDENGGLMLGPSRIEETDGPIQYSIEPGFSRPPATHGDYNVLFESESFTAVIDLFKLDNDYGELYFSTSLHPARNTQVLSLISSSTRAAKFWARTRQHSYRCNVAGGYELAR